jgi:hypothetical protein
VSKICSRCRHGSAQSPLVMSSSQTRKPATARATRNRVRQSGVAGAAPWRAASCRASRSSSSDSRASGDERGALGLPLAGLIGEHGDYHLLLRICVAGGGVSVLGGWLFLTEPPQRAPARFDLPGAILLAAALVVPKPQNQPAQGQPA